MHLESENDELDSDLLSYCFTSKYRIKIRSRLCPLQYFISVFADTFLLNKKLAF